MRKVKEPKFKKGDTVLCDFVRPGLLTILEDPFWNGFMWMYSFEGSDTSCGELYVSPAPTTPTNTIQEQKELHTGGEWKVIDSGKIDGVGDISIVCDRNGERVHIIAKIHQGTLTRAEKLANAELIVKSVNNYPKLIEVVKELREKLEEVTKEYNYSLRIIADVNHCEYSENHFSKETKKLIKKSKEILP